MVNGDEPVVLRSGQGATDPDHGIRIEAGAFGPWQTNAYLVWDGRSSEALVVDPGMGAAEPLVQRLAANDLDLRVIANSHGHLDHIFDDAPLMQASDAPLAIHPDDAYRLDGRNNYGYQLDPVTATRHLTEGEQVRIGDLVLDVLHLPGHTEGSVCLYEERLGLLLSGDVLFAGAFGRTDLAGGSDEQMVESLRRLVRDLPDTTRVLPGHGPETTMAQELPWLRRVAATGQLVVG